MLFRGFEQWAMLQPVVWSQLRGVLLSVSRNSGLSTVFVSFGYKHSIVNVKAEMLLFRNLKKLDLKNLFCKLFFSYIFSFINNLYLVYHVCI